ncbi:hypothetical protein D0Z00_000359 [Geotrichum galactomycetum]|uniref:Uncharacterized protein n=1 Tax=Geotrichum galactomycetum TaxID=27317 RepID=A0ACB6VA33_9ASCO|nr:hypothetical protein D0Z00_000359 [Geotrichum candidum]
MNDDSFSDTNASFHRSKSGGITQTIRLKLNFMDERQWKKFSARRLELIDSLSLSERKASEQDDDITGVADRLRIEYGYPSEALIDFEKLVRAGIQSVRRNRKRVPKFKTHGSSPTAVSAMPHQHNYHKRGGAAHYTTGATAGSVSPKPTLTSMLPSGPSTKDADTDMLDVAEDHRGRIAISALVSPDSSSTKNNSNNSYSNTSTPRRQSIDSSASARIQLPPLKNLDPIPEQMRNSIDQLVSYLDRSELPANQDVAKLEYAGFSILHTAATISVQARGFGTADDYIRFINSVLLSKTALLAISNVLPASSVLISEQQLIEHLKIKVAIAAIVIGFDSVIRALAAVFEDMVNFDQLPDGQHYDFHFNSNGNTSANPNQTCTQLPSPGSSTAPSITPVTLRFLAQKLDFTYAPGSSTPPTIIEILDNGKSAFHILGDNKVLKIRNLNAGGAVVETDADLAEIFETPHIDLELFFPVFDNVSITSAGSASSIGSSGFGSNNTGLPSTNNPVSRNPKGMRFQEVL